MSELPRLQIGALGRPSGAEADEPACPIGPKVAQQATKDPDSLWKELSFDGATFHIKQGGRILISHSPAQGYGFGGLPGSWTQLYGSRSPTDWGLDPDKGVVAFDGSRAYAVPAPQLVEIFGSGWRQIVYA